MEILFLFNLQWFDFFVCGKHVHFAWNDVLTKLTLRFYHRIFCIFLSNFPNRIADSSPFFLHQKSKESLNHSRHRTEPAWMSEEGVSLSLSLARNAIVFILLSHKANMYQASGLKDVCRLRQTAGHDGVERQIICTILKWPVSLTRPGSQMALWHSFEMQFMVS